ncbi:MAG TPA: winged helix-turn-helix domain-containing protein, partial [Acidimicrobiales bacterium]
SSPGTPLGGVTVELPPVGVSHAHSIYGPGPADGEVPVAPRSRATEPWHQLAGSVLVGAGTVESAVQLARGLAESGLLPTLTFDEVQLVDTALSASFDVIVVSADVTGDLLGVARRLGARPDAVIVLVGGDEVAPADLVEAGVELRLPAGSGAAEVADCALALLGLRFDPHVRRLMRWGPLVLDPARRSVSLRGTTIRTTPLQFRMLATLVRAQGAVMSKEQVHRMVWGQLPIDDGSRVKAHIQRLRRLLGDQLGTPHLLVTVRGEGYCLAEPEEWAVAGT